MAHAPFSMNTQSHRVYPCLPSLQLPIAHMPLPSPYLPADHVLLRAAAPRPWTFMGHEAHRAAGYPAHGPAGQGAPPPPAQPHGLGIPPRSSPHSGGPVGEGLQPVLRAPSAASYAPSMHTPPAWASPRVSSYTPVPTAGAATATGPGVNTQQACRARPAWGSPGQWLASQGDVAQVSLAAQHIGLCVCALHTSMCVLVCSAYQHVRACV